VGFARCVTSLFAPAQAIDRQLRPDLWPVPMTPQERKHMFRSSGGRRPVQEKELILKDAQNLAFYGVWFAADSNARLDSERRVPTEQERQFQRIRKRYETDERPFLGHD
jgi:hypothetical protein